jgi:hypothetical protein
VDGGAYLVVVRAGHVSGGVQPGDVGVLIQIDDDVAQLV